MAKGVIERLGWVADRPGVVTGRPAGLAALPDLPAAPEGPAGFLLAFVAESAAVAPAAATLLPRYPARDGKLWFAYPKKSGPLRTDITRDRGWEALTAAGFLPVAQVAIDGTWSALRFRRRDEIAKVTRRADLPGAAG